MRATPLPRRRAPVASTTAKQPAHDPAPAGDAGPIAGTLSPGTAIAEAEASVTTIAAAVAAYPRTPNSILSPPAGPGAPEGQVARGLPPARGGAPDRGRHLGLLHLD